MGKPDRGLEGWAGAEQTGPGDDSGEGGAARSRSSSETVTRRGVKQKTEAEPSSMVAESNHLLSEARTGYGLTNCTNHLSIAKPVQMLHQEAGF